MDLSDSFQILYSLIRDLGEAPDGISTGDIVRKYGISRRLVPKYMTILEDAGVPIYVERKRYYLLDEYRAPLILSPEESEFLYLALERSFIFHSEQWRTLRALLGKLSSKMPHPLADYLNRREETGPSLKDHIFQILARAKRQQQEVRVDYLPLNREDSSQWFIQPFRFTSNPLSDGLYVLCYGTRQGDDYIPLSLKFDRILNAEPTSKRFGSLETSRFTASAGQSWAVWSSERPPVQVMLRFEPRHYDRLLETIWHSTQSITVDPDGYVTFTVRVSEPMEMVPWIRSWGSGVVVMEPLELRQRVVRSLQRQLLAYGLNAAPATDPTPLAYLWAKYDQRNQIHHLLHYHLLDAAAVALLMCQHVLSSAQRDWLTTVLDLDYDSVCRILALLTGLHDIGKASPAFQQKVPQIYEAAVALGLLDERAFDEPHGTLSAVMLTTLLVKHGVRERTARMVASVIGGHHGKWISGLEFKKARGAVGRQSWMRLQEDIFALIKDTLGVSQIVLPEDELQLNVFSAFFSGFVSVCDWIASNEVYFPYEPNLMDADIYLRQALLQAETALMETGWLGWKPSGVRQPFDALFPFTANPLQATAIAQCDFEQAPRLVLVEYLTGGGKTELALYLADQLINKFGRAGLYVAMPTQTTSNQMFDRVKQFLQARYPDQSVNLQLVHAQAEHHPLYQHETQPDRKGNESAVAAARWFEPRKRALLAPFAVGTIDQAMLAVLQARHHFVRLYGISHKVIIGDEIHNYDTYMYTIIERMLVWMKALNSTPILLSATLSRRTRERLVEQVAAPKQTLPDVAYPRLTVVDHEGRVQVHPLPAPTGRKLLIKHMDPDLTVLCQWLSQLYQSGGCVAILCNTVDEAITIAHALRQVPEIAAEDVLLFHARFPSAWRSVIEEKVLSYFGKHGQRPARAILVATQIIEQSLDLDFDLMITSTAPVDLLIQRAGRLHRHGGRARPAHLQEPVLVIRAPMFNDSDVPDFGVDAVVYARYVMLKTWLVLRERTQLVIPDEIDDLVNFVYDMNVDAEKVSAGYSATLQAAYEDMIMGENSGQFKGEQYCIGQPDSLFLIGGSTYDLPDDEEHAVTTRDIRPGVDIICMGTGHSKSELPVLHDRKPTRDEVKKLLIFRITVRSMRVRQALESVQQNPHWRRVAQLQYARPIIFENNIYRIPGSTYTLRLTPFYGLEILEDNV